MRIVNCGKRSSQRSKKVTEEEYKSAWIEASYIVAGWWQQEKSSKHSTVTVLKKAKILKVPRKFVLGD